MFSHSGFQRPGVFNRHRLGLRHYPAHALHGHRLHCRLQVEDVKVHGAIDDGPIRRIHCCVGLHIAMCFRNLSNKYFNRNIPRHTDVQEWKCLSWTFQAFHEALLHSVHL